VYVNVLILTVQIRQKL